MPKCKDCFHYRGCGNCNKIASGTTSPLRDASGCKHFKDDPSKVPSVPSGETVAKAAGAKPVSVEDITPRKVCKKCGQVKPLSEFVKRSRAKDGTIDTCKECYTKNLQDKTIARAARIQAKSLADAERDLDAAIESIGSLAEPVEKVEVRREVIAAFDLQGLPDDKLIAELRSRGYAGTLTRTVVTEITI